MHPVETPAREYPRFCGSPEGRGVRLIQRGTPVLPMALLVAMAGLVIAASRVRAQSVLNRSPNLGGSWVGSPGVVYFNFLHRFVVGEEPQRKVTNGPTFLLAAGLPGGTLIGLSYATASQVVRAKPNEWEFFARWNSVAQARTGVVDLTVHGGWNQAAESFDGEVTLARRFGRLRLLAAGRAFSNAFDHDESRVAIAGGAALTIVPNVAIAGDVATLLNTDADEDAAWGVGLQLQIPYTPHTLSLQATNTNTATLQGSSIGTSETRYGFEFTIPFTLARYFGGRGATSAASNAPERIRAEQAAGESRQIVMQNLRYGTTTLEVARGTTVTWINRDAVAHTVTSGDGVFDSALIDAGESWSRTFTEAGTFAYYCTPHPFMKATIIVR